MSPRKIIVHIARWGALACGVAVATAGANELTIEFTLKDAKAGQVYFSVYDSAGNWMKKPLRSGMVMPVGAVAKTVLTDLAPGEYAVTAFQDVNGNGKLDSNFFKIPTEPSGFSNDASGSFGPASFEQARFKLASASEKVGMTLK